MSSSTTQHFLDAKYKKIKSTKKRTELTTLLLPFLPESLLLTLDLLPLTTVPQFRGFHSIPPGWHFICTATSASFSIRHGLWFHVLPSPPPANGSGPSPRTSNGNTSPVPQSSHTDDSEDSDSDSDLDPPSNLSTSRLLSFSWSPTLEALTPTSPLSSEDLRRLHRSTPRTALLPYLSTSPSSPESFPNTSWARLTSRLSHPLLSNLTSSPTLAMSSASTSAQDMETIPGLSREEVRKFLKPEDAGDGGDDDDDGGNDDNVEPELQFLGIDLKRTWRAGAVGRERTDGARDRSWLLGEIVRKAGETRGVEDGNGSEEWGRDVLAELQVCFLMALLLGNYACAQEWKRVVEVVLTARMMLVRQEAFFVAFLENLGLQLKVASEQAEEEGGFFDFGDGETGEGAWLRKLLVGFQESLDEVFERAGGGEVRESLGRLEEWVQDNKGWGFFKNERKVLEGRVVVGEDGERVQIRGLGGTEEWGLGDDDDEAPVVVDLGEDG